MTKEQNDWGITRLSIVPVRKEPDHRSEQVTQLLFGDHYTVVQRSRDNDWLRIRIQFDNYEGWISNKQHHDISQEYFQEINKNEYRICTELTSMALYRKKPILIVIGSILPVSDNEIFGLGEHFAFNGESKSLGQKRDAEFLNQTCLKLLNVPYLWGGKSPFGMDCSGFIQMVFKISGYSLHRDSGDQVKQGIELKDFTKTKPGDLAFFIDGKGKVNHVGLIMDDRNTIIHCSGYVRIDKIDEKGIFNESSGEYTHKFFTARRILK
jgi:hypothetical protein